MLSSIAQTIQAVAGLIGVLVWPVVVLLVARWMLPELRKLLGETRTVGLKGAGFELSIERVAEVTADLVVAGAKEGTSTSEAATAAASQVGELHRSGVLQQLARANVLWVDDHPENNEYERRALQKLGIKIDLALSTSEAVRRMRGTRYDLLISDLGRQTAGEDDPDAGLKLVEALRGEGSHIPVIVYAGSRGIRKRPELMRAGASGVTNRPTDLLALVVDNLPPR